jgi:hypothetical protein
MGGWGIPLRPDPFLLVSYTANLIARQMVADPKYAYDPAKLSTAIKDAVINTMVSGPLPVAQPLKVMAEVYTNYSSFTTRPIVGQYQGTLDSYMQFSNGTSVLSKGIGESAKNILDAVGIENTGLSPAKLDHVIKGMLGMYGGAVILMFNQLSNEKPSESAMDILASTPGMGRVGVKTFDTQLKTDFFDLANKVTSAVNTLNAYKKAGQGDEYRKYASDNADRLKYRTTVASIQRQLSGISTSLRVISESNRTKAEKSEATQKLKEQEQRMLNNLAPLIKKMRTESL